MKKKNKKHGATPRPSELLGQKLTPGAEEVAEPEAEVAEMDKTYQFQYRVLNLDDVIASHTEAQVEAQVEEAKVEAEAEAEAPKAEASTLEQMVANLPPELREKAQAELDKLVVQARKNVQAKAFVAFDNALKDTEKGLPKFIGDLAKTHGVDLTSRRITITYPDGKFSYTNAPKGSKGSGNGSRQGFPSQWGEAEVIEGEKTTKHASPSKAAEALGLQVEGMRDMPDVFLNPHERGTKAVLPKIYSVDAVRGEHFRVTIKH